MSAVLVNDGRILLAQALIDRPAYFGIGAGSADWGTSEPPTAGLEQINMVTPIGYKLAHVVQFVRPDEAGDIVLTSGRYALSEQPTNHLNYRLRLEYGEVMQDVREIHVYVDTQLVSGLPVGQRYFAPEDVAKTGRLLLAERRKPLFFDGTVGAEINLVVTF